MTDQEERPRLPVRLVRRRHYKLGCYGLPIGSPNLHQTLMSGSCLDWNRRQARPADTAFHELATNSSERPPSFLHSHPRSRPRSSTSRFRAQGSRARADRGREGKRGGSHIRASSRNEGTRLALPMAAQAIGLQRVAFARRHRTITLSRDYPIHFQFFKGRIIRCVSISHHQITGHHFLRHGFRGRELVRIDIGFILRRGGRGKRRPDRLPGLGDVDTGHGRQPRPDRVLSELISRQRDSHRDTFNDMNEVSRGVIRRQ